jgi:hypothetical protein
MENLAELTTGRKLDELENYFQTYGDLPREIILKHDLLRVGHWFTDAALELASQALVKSYRLFSYDLMAMKDMKRKEHRKIPEWFTVRRGAYDLRPVSIQTTLDSSSPTSSTRWMVRPSFCSTAKRFAKSIFPSR